MRRIVVLGASGQLGHYVTQVFTDELAPETGLVIPVDRSAFDCATADPGDLLLRYWLASGDVIINCAADLARHDVRVNVGFPAGLAAACIAARVHLVHISTDAVYSGGRSTERDNVDVARLAGRYPQQKAIADAAVLAAGGTVVRCSFVGHAPARPGGETHGTATFLEHALDGTRPPDACLWNGVTALELARTLLAWVRPGAAVPQGAIHVFTDSPPGWYCTRAELTQLIRAAYARTDTPRAAANVGSSSHDRTLATVRDENNRVLTPFTAQLRELRAYHAQHANRVPYSVVAACRFCAQRVRHVAQLPGRFPLAGEFLAEADAPQTLYPLGVVWCDSCRVLMCRERVPADVLFERGYHYRSSAIPALRDHFRRYARHLAARFPADALVVEMGCNDGVLLRELAACGFRRVLGVDPSGVPLTQGVPNDRVLRRRFDPETARRIVVEHGRADVWTASNSFAHVHDMAQVLEAVTIVLAESGSAFVEVHDSTKLVDEMQFDFVYHEHMTYYTATALCRIAARFGLRVVDYRAISTHGTSIRVEMTHAAGAPDPSPALTTRLLWEDRHHFQSMACYQDFFRARLGAWREHFLETLAQLDATHPVRIGYGASGRASVLSALCGNLSFDFVVDDAPNKHGLYTPGNRAPIKPLSALDSLTEPFYVVLLAWPYRDAILPKLTPYGACVVVPLPSVRVLHPGADPLQ